MTDPERLDGLATASASEPLPIVPQSPRERWEVIGARPMVRRGQGSVWRVRDRTAGPGPHFALKEMKYHHGPTSLAYRRFVREISVMTDLSGAHKGIVPVIAHGIPIDGDSWQPFYVMPLAESSLERAKDLAGSLESVLKIGIQIAEALEVAHERGIVHRDVKPGNVLLFGDERRPALADFGICHLTEDDRLTGTDAQTVGSRDYVAPELLGGGQREDVSPNVDTYSLGKTLYAVAAGRHPFPREAHLEEEWNLAIRLEDRRFEHLHGLLERMVTSESSARFATMRECREAMERALENVQAGRSYAAGMYGGGRVPLERFSRATASLGRLSGLQHEDAKLALLEESERLAHDFIVNTTPRGLDIEYARELSQGDATLAATCANHLMVGGLVAIALGDDSLLDEWWERIRHLALTEELLTRRDILLSNAAVGSAYAIAAVAWRRRRWKILRDVTSTIAKDGRRFVYLRVAEGDSNKSAAWLAELLGQSEAVAAVEAAIADDSRLALGIVAGLALLRDLAVETPSEELRKMLGDGVQITGAEYAALDPEHREWMAVIGNACIRSSAVARGVAAVLDVPSPAELLPVLRWVTPVIQRWMGQIGRRRSVDTFSLRHLGSHGPWARWINAGEVANDT